MRVAHISGHWDLTEDEFQVYYVERIIEALNKGDRFVMGDCPGCDDLAQFFLIGKKFIADYRDQIENSIVYSMYSKPKINHGFRTVYGLRTADRCDEAMTLSSDYDIAWVRPGKENSNTAKNLKRRESLRTE